MSQEIHGIAGAPYQTPSVRKKLPDPHTRARIDLDGGTRAKRSWKDTSVLTIKAGDVVSGVGRVASAEEVIEMPDMLETSSEWIIRLTNVWGEAWDFTGNQRVYAFTPDPAGE